MIDPTEAAIAWAVAVLPSLEGRVAVKHKYGAPGWTLGADALTLTPTTGAVQDDAGTARQRLEARAYGATPQRAAAVMLALTDAADAWVRGPVALPSGETALLYWFVPDDAIEHAFDSDLKLDYVRRPFGVNVALLAI